MGLNSLESEGTARGRELFKPIIPKVAMFYLLYIPPDWLKWSQPLRP